MSEIYTRLTRVLRDLAPRSNDGDLRGPALDAADVIDTLLARAQKAEAQRDTAWNDAIEAAAQRIESLGFSSNLIRSLCKGDTP